MSKSDVKMENSEKNPHDLENKVQDSEIKAPDSNIEGEGGKLSCVDAVSDDSSKMKNHVEGINGSRNGDKDSIEVKEQTNPKSEGNEPIDASIPKQTGMTDEIEKPIDIKTEDEEMSAMDVDNNASEQNITSGEEEKQEKSTKNCLDGENNLRIVEEKSNENLAEKEPKELAKGGADYVEHVEGDNKSIPKGAADRVENVPGENMSVKTDDVENDPSQNKQLPTELPSIEANQTQNAEMGEVPLDEVDKMKHSSNSDGDTAVKHTEEHGEKVVLAKRETGENTNTVETTTKHDEDSSFANQQEPSTPNSLNRDSLAKAVDHSGGTAKSVFTPTALPLMGEDDDGTPEEQVAFMKEIESFYKLKAIDFKPPKFYGQPLNCLKLWRAVIRLGGYDRVTGSKLWRQVGESFHPPKTCTTVSWTFRIFYEKSLLEYERHKIQSGELQLPTAAFPEASGVDVEGNGHQGSGRARRDAAARAMQGWHTQRLSDYGEVGEPIMKDKNLNNVAKREKNLKSIGSLKQKRPSEAEHSNKAPRIETPKQLTTSVVDVGPPADWVKINVQQTKDCFEIYALVPGLLREEVRVQTDPAGRVVITGQPEQVDNPWGITPFRKVVSLPSRIDPIQTSAVVSLHGRLFIRVPFEQQPNP